MAFLAPTPINLSSTQRIPIRTIRPQPCRTPRRNPARPPPTSKADQSSQQVDANASDAKEQSRVLLWREVELLKRSLQIAVSAERFSDAARLRDQIESLSLADDYFRTDKELKKAVSEERFSDAAHLRDVLKALDPPPGSAVLRDEAKEEAVVENNPLLGMDPADAENWSRTKTAGIVVHIESYYMPEQSLPEHNRFLFGYKVSIKNEAQETCQLVSRHWVINSVGGPQSEVKGPGVVGRQPVLEPGESFEYTSACPISVPLQSGQSVVGSMSGQYHFCKGDTGTERFSVEVDRFYFKLPFKNFRRSGPVPPGMPWPKP